MIALHYKLTTFADYLQQLARLFQTEVVGDKLTIPPRFGKGYFKCVQVHNDLQALIYDINLNDNLILRREREPKEFYTLVFDEVISAGNGYSISIGSEKIHDMEKPVALYLTSFLYDVENILHKDVNVRGIRILLPVSWMQQYLQLDEKESVLQKYIELKTAGIKYKPVGDELRGILKDLMSEEEIPLLFYQNKILRIIERFFAWLYNEMQMISDRSGISLPDIEAAQKIEGLLTNDVTQLPPTIKEMARDAAMSESKLKKVFKAVYGIPPYEYYQQQRMQKARLMLLTGQYSIKDVGYTLGYANLSNFTLAFKKVFGQLPRDLVKNRAK